VASKRFPAKKKKNRTETAVSTGAQLVVPAPAAPLTGWRQVWAWVGFTVVVLAACSWVLSHAYLVDTVTVRLCENMDRDMPAEKRMPVFLAEIAFDGYMWNHLAEHLGENGEWRARYTYFDNAPAGREVHWSSGFALYLRGLGEIYRAINGDSLRNSIFRMSIWANPIILVLAIGIFSTLSARRFGPLCGTVIAIGMVAVPTFYEGFMPAYPDHHGIIAFCILGMLFGIAWAGAGWVQAPEGNDFVPPHSIKQARHGMVFSAICGAAGMWLSAFSIVVVVLGIGIAALVSVAALSGRGSKKNPSVFHPEVWKLWGISGALGSLFFYAFEYFPFQMGMRLEVNHPLYALAWFAGGYGIFISTKWIVRSDRSLQNIPWQALILCSLACAVLPAFILANPSKFYIVLEPFMAKMSANIAETLPLLVRIKTGGLTLQMAFGWFPVFLVVAAAMLFSSKVGRGTKATLCFLSIPILVITSLQFYQVRWGMLAGPLYIALAGIVIPQIWRLVPAKLTERLLVAAMLVGFAYLFIAPSFSNCFTGSWAQFQKGTKDIPISFGQGLALLHRQMARAILDSAGDMPVVLLSSPNSSCMLVGLGGFRGVGALYWENVEGLKKAARTLNAQSDDEALAKIRELGVTHISVMTWENFIAPFFFILYPEPIRGKSLENSFARRALENKQIPIWTRPLAFPPNDLSKGLQQQILLLQVAPEQSREEAKFHIGRFARFVEGNPIAAEMTFKEILDVAPKSTLVRFELADLFVAQKRYQEAVNQILKALPDGDPAQRSALARKFVPALGSAGQWKLRSDLIKALVAYKDADAEALENAAWILSTSPDPDARDATLALACSDRRLALPEPKPELLLARAAALAASGEFEKAALTAREAGARAPSDKSLQDRANEMSAAFDAGQIWTMDN